MAQKKKWKTVNIDEFFLEQGTVQYGPPAPASHQQRGMSAPGKEVFKPEARVKIPKPGPSVPAGTSPKTSKKRIKRTTLELLGNESEFNPIVIKTNQKSGKLNLIRSLPDRLQQAIVSGDKVEEQRLRRLMRNLDELKKAKRRPYNSPGVIEAIEEKIAKDRAADPQRALARGLIEQALDLEVNMYDPRAARWSAFMPDVDTPERINIGSSTRLRDIKTNPRKFRPVSKAQKKQARAVSKSRQSLINVQNMMVYRNQAFLAEMKRPVRSPIFGPPAPFTQEAADQELAFFRQKVGFEKGSKSVYQARVYRQILDIDTEIDFLDRLPKDMQR